MLPEGFEPSLQVHAGQWSASGDVPECGEVSSFVDLMCARFALFMIIAHFAWLLSRCAITLHLTDQDYEYRSYNAIFSATAYASLSNMSCAKVPALWHSVTLCIPMCKLHRSV